MKISKALRATAEENGISYKLLRYRLSKKWDETRAATEPPRKQASIVKSNPDMLALAKENGISSSNYKYRVRELGWDEFEAATRPLMNQTEKAKLSAEARGGIPDHLVKIAASNGISYITLYRRLRVYTPAWEINRAITEPPIQDRLPLKKQLNDIAESMGIDWKAIRARQYHAHRKYDPVLIAIAEANGVKYDTLVYRLVTSKTKWSPIEAATVKPDYGNNKVAQI